MLSGNEADSDSLRRIGGTSECRRGGPCPHFAHTISRGHIAHRRSTSHVPPSRLAKPDSTTFAYVGSSETIPEECVGAKTILERAPLRQGGANRATAPSKHSSDQDSCERRLAVGFQHGWKPYGNAFGANHCLATEDPATCENLAGQLPPPGRWLLIAARSPVPPTATSRCAGDSTSAPSTTCSPRRSSSLPTTSRRPQNACRLRTRYRFVLDPMTFG